MCQQYKPCPFCGNVDFHENDSLHPSGITWYDSEEIGRVYGKHNQYINRCWVFRCPCGVEVNGDSAEDVIAKWNCRYIETK